MSKNSSINTADLQRFHDSVAPLVATLPSVIDAYQRKDELERNLATLKKEVDETKADTERQLDVRNAQLQAARDQLTETGANLRTAQQELRDVVINNKRRVDEAEKEANALIEQQKARVVAAAAEADKAESQKKARIDSVNADVAAAMEAGHMELQTLESKLANSRLAVEELRKKLGD